MFKSHIVPGSFDMKTNLSLPLTLKNRSKCQKTTLIVVIITTFIEYSAHYFQGKVKPNIECEQDISDHAIFSMIR